MMRKDDVLAERCENLYSKAFPACTALFQEQLAFTSVRSVAKVTVPTLELAESTVYNYLNYIVKGAYYALIRPDTIKSGSYLNRFSWFLYAVGASKETEAVRLLRQYDRRFRFYPPNYRLKVNKPVRVFREAVLTANEMLQAVAVNEALARLGE